MNTESEVIPVEIFCTVYYVLNYVKTVPQIVKLIRTRSSSDYSLSMIILQLIMSASGIMNVGFEKAYLLQTDLNRTTSDIIAIYVYEQGIVSARYELGTAVGLFNTAINIVLLLIVNRIAKKFGDVNFV